MKRIIRFIVMVCLLSLVTGCGYINVNNNSTSIIDYGDAESFEAALRAGENLEGKIVQFKVIEFHPDSEWGYNLWAGEHLNFVSTRNPDVKEGDEVVVKAKIIENILGSWKISYEKITNAIEDENTIYSSANSEKDSESVSAGNDTEKEEIKDSPSAPAVKENQDDPEGTFANNQYYDVVEEATYSNSGSYTTKIYKVLAKQNGSIEATMLAYSPEGSVIGKSTSDITLTEGDYNYFKFMLESDISEATFDTKIKTKKTYSEGDRNAIEMVDYNVSGDDLYITFRQVTDNPGSFAKFKLLFYSGDQITGDEDGYFSVYADNLSGRDSTDVAELWVYRKTFDRIEFIYEP